MRCKLRRFYGFLEPELDRMDIDTVMMYWKGIDMLEAQETLLGLKLSEYPNMEMKDKRKLTQSLEKKAYFKQEVKVIKTSDIAKFLGAR